MYVVSIVNGNQKLDIHTPYVEDKNKKLPSGEIVEKTNSISSFSFKIFSNNIGFNDLYEYSTLISVYNLKTNKYDFKGRVLTNTSDMDNKGNISKDIVCEDYFGFLNDSKQHYVDTKDWTVLELIDHILNDHNSQVEDYKKFKLGVMQLEDDNDNLYLGIQRETTWKTIEEKILKKLGGEIQFRDTDDGLYIDFYKTIGETKTTSIELAKNMKSISKASDVSSFVTRLVPLGSKIKKTDEQGNEKESEERVGIESVNDNIEYIDDKVAISVYGIIRGYQTWDDVSNPSTLLSKAKRWLADNNKVNISYDVSALELALINKDIDMFDLYNYYPVRNTLLNVDDTLRVIKKTINIVSPENSKMELGNVYKTLTDIQTDRNQKVDNMEETIKDVANNISDQAITNVTNNLTSLIQQYADSIISTVAKTYISESDLESYKNEISTQFEQTSETFQMVFKSITEQINVIDGNVTSNYDELIKYIRFVDGTIVLGQVGNEVTLQLQNDRLSFFQNGVEVAYMSNNVLYILDATFLRSLRINNFAFIPRKNGSLDFKMIGGV